MKVAITDAKTYRRKQILVLSVFDAILTQSLVVEWSVVASPARVISEVFQQLTLVLAHSDQRPE